MKSTVDEQRKLKGAVTVSDEVTVRRLGDELVMMDLGSGKYFHLNESATLAWDMLTSGAMPAEISSRFREVYGLEEDEAAEDVESLLRALIETGLVAEP